MAAWLPIAAGGISQNPCPHPPSDAQGGPWLPATEEVVTGPGGPAGELDPVLAEAAPLPPKDGSRGYDDEGLPPPCPDPGQPDPEEAIRRAKLGPGRRPPVHGELVAQGQVLEGELAMAAAKEREESKVEQEGDHRAEILSGSAPTDQRLAAGRGFGEGQAMRISLIPRPFARRANTSP